MILPRSMVKIMVVKKKTRKNMKKMNQMKRIQLVHPPKILRSIVIIFLQYFIQELLSSQKMPLTIYHVRKCFITQIKPIPGSQSKIRRVRLIYANCCIAGKSKFVKHPIVDTKTGWHWFTKATRASDFTTYGVGITLYFQFLKFLATIFFVMSIVSIPAYIFFSSGNSSTQETSADLKTQLASLSLGNIG